MQYKNLHCLKFLIFVRKLKAMNRDTLIKKTLKNLSKLPQEKVREITDFSDFIMKKYEEETLQKGIEKIVSHSKSFEFLNEEEDLYSLDDLKEKY